MAAGIPAAVFVCSYLLNLGDFISIIIYKCSNIMEILEHGKYYHIYNRGNNRCNLFYTNDNYRSF
jgi:hypothetical protein